MAMNWYTLASRQVSLKLDKLLDDNCALDSLNHRLTRSMNPKTAATCTCGHFNKYFLQ